MSNSVLSITKLDGTVVDKFSIGPADNQLSIDTLAYVMRDWNRECIRHGIRDDYCLVAPNGSRFDGEFTENWSIKYLDDLKDWFYSNL